MSFDRRELATCAIARAMLLRRQMGHKLWDAICPFDISERLGVEVRFRALPTMEGTYAADLTHPTIVISSLRPAGRQAFTCAHEIGHQLFGHGVRLDEVVDLMDTPRGSDPEEFLADAFAGALLMPKVAVDRGLSCRACTPTSCNPQQLFQISGWLGVGYETLIRHMQYALRVIDASCAKALLRTKPAQLRREILGADCPTGLYVVDHNWIGRPVDIAVGDVIVMPAGGHASGTCIRTDVQDSSRTVLRGQTPGVGRLGIENTDWSIFVRVSRLGYEGRSRYRHFEEIADE